MNKAVVFIALAAMTFGLPARADDQIERLAGFWLANMVYKNIGCAGIQSPNERGKYTADYLKRADAIYNKVMDKMTYISKSDSVSVQFKGAFMYSLQEFAKNEAAGWQIKVDGVDVKFNCGNPAHLTAFEGLYRQFEEFKSSATQ